MAGQAIDVELGDFADCDCYMCAKLYPMTNYVGVKYFIHHGCGLRVWIPLEVENTHCEVYTYYIPIDEYENNRVYWSLNEEDKLFFLRMMSQLLLDEEVLTHYPLEKYKSIKEKINDYSERMEEKLMATTEKCNRLEYDLGSVQLDIVDLTRRLNKLECKDTGEKPAEPWIEHSEHGYWVEGPY